MILEYHRPQELQQALELLARPQPATKPLAGGSALNQPSEQDFAVVDLQALSLDQVTTQGKNLLLGATLTLEAMLALPDLPAGLRPVLLQEASSNLRQVATIAGTLVAADGRSPLAAALLAMDAQLLLQPGKQSLSLGDLYALRQQTLHQRLIVQLRLPINVSLAYHAISRTPADFPLVCAAACRWSSGRTRLTLGGYGAAPLLVSDGAQDSAPIAAAESAYLTAQDAFASHQYRSAMAGVLVKRCLATLDAA